MPNLTSTQKIYSRAYFILLLLVSVLLYRDFGMSWDEVAQQQIGVACYEYIFQGKPEYLESFDRIYGVGFELPLILLEKLFNLKTNDEIYQFRHLMYALFFSFSCFLFFKLNLQLFKNTLVAFVPTLIVLLTPRIFGHAFFNSKDIPFLGMNMICFYVLYTYMIKSSWGNMLLLAICTGLLVNFRILGVFFAGLVFGTMIILSIRKGWKVGVLHPPVYLAMAGLLLYITWPFLWNDPYYNFIFVFKCMSKFAVRFNILFNGVIIKSGDITMTYLFTWILYSVPAFYLILSATGIILFFLKNIKNPMAIICSKRILMGWIFIASFAIPLLSVYYYQSVLYDDWRQLYFIWPSVAVFSGYLFYWLRKWSRRLATLGYALIFSYLGFIAIQMVILHPYEHVYFNEMISKDRDYLQQHFEGDYWGVSYYDGLRFLLKHDERDKIPLRGHNYPLERNLWMLPQREIQRFKLTDDLLEGSYYLTTLRSDPWDTLGTRYYTQVIYEIKRQNSVILRIWKK